MERWRSEAATIREENHRLTKQLQQQHNKKANASDLGNNDAGDDGGFEKGVDVKVVDEHVEKEASEHYIHLRRQFEAIAHIHLLQKEMVRLQQQQRTTHKEKSQLEKERDVLMEQEKTNRAALLRQLGEINTRIDKQRTTVTNLSTMMKGPTKKNEFNQDHNEHHDDKEYQSAMRTLRNYEEHREELEDRLEQPWALSEDTSLRLQELIDEIGNAPSQHPRHTHLLIKTFQQTPSQHILSTHPVNKPFYISLHCHSYILLTYTYTHSHTSYQHIS